MSPSVTDKTTIVQEKVTPASAPEAHSTVAAVISIGKKSRKKIRKLQKGQGPLILEIEDAVRQLQDSGTLAAGAQTVVVVVKEKPKISGLFS
jgi:hypothetical protein